jgi:hypothetical protein
MAALRHATTRPRNAGSTVAFIAAATIAVVGARTADARPAGIAPTLSGFPSAPRSERALRIGRAGVAVRFRAPVSGDVATAHTFWKRATGGCTVSLHEDGGRTPGGTLATAALPDGAEGWVAASLGVRLAAGSAYELVVACDPGGGARLGYVVDGDRTAEKSGAWRLERLRSDGRLRGRRRGSPLFAFAFADGRWWGQPYRAAGHRPALTVCGARELAATLVPSRPLVTTDVRMPRGRHRKPVAFTLQATDGSTVLASVGPDGPSSLGRVHPAPARLAADTRYTLRLRGAHRHRGCFRARALVTDLAVGPSVAGLAVAGLRASADGGRTWSDVAAPGVTLGLTLVGSAAPLASCGDGHLDADEECDGSADDACPRRCSSICTCPVDAPPATCGNGTVDAGEQCDGAADAACPGRCTDACTCSAAPARSYRSIYPSGYLATYDPETTGVWPKRLGLMLGEAEAQGPLVAPARALAVANGNRDARFIFYLSLTDMDSRCHCFDQGLYDSFRGQHPEWILRDGGGNPVSTNNGIGRLFATDVGNPAYVEAWADWAIAAADKWGWDGTFVDNVFRGYFDGWSTTPVNPRTERRYTTEEYRADILAAVRRLRARFEAKGKMLVGNHTQAWDPSTFADPITRAEVMALGGVEIEDCVYDWNDQPHTEREWIGQLAYLEFANAHGVRTVCSSSTAIGHANQREYLLASYLLTKRAFSSISELNTLDDWWSGLETDLGGPSGHFTCLDPGAGFAPSADCPSAGKVYVREWEKGRVVVNPSGSATVTVPLGGEFVRNGTRVWQVTLAPHQGAVLVKP